VTVSVAPGGPQDLGLGAVTDRGDGTYAFDVTAGTTPGLAELVVVVDDGVRPVTLYPYPSLRVDALAPLHVGFDTLDALAAPRVPFVLNEPAAAGGLQLVLASLSGTRPGFDLGGGVLLPLNRDAAFDWTLANAGGPFLPGTLGGVDAAGRAASAFAPTPGLLAPLVGARVDWAALWLAGGTLGATNPVGFDVVAGD